MSLAPLHFADILSLIYFSLSLLLSLMPFVSMSSFFTEIVFFTEIQISQHRSHIFHFVKTAIRAVKNAVRNAVKNAREKIYVLKPCFFFVFIFHAVFHGIFHSIFHGIFHGSNCSLSLRGESDFGETRDFRENHALSEKRDISRKNKLLENMFPCRNSVRRRIQSQGSVKNLTNLHCFVSTL